MMVRLDNDSARAPKTLPPVGLTLSEVKINLKQWQREQTRFEVRVNLRAQGAMVYFHSDYRCFQLVDGLGREKVFKSIPSLHQMLSRLLPPSLLEKMVIELN